ncbi:MAG: hypothetical protein NTZ55_04380 [Candidatus Roizmanbacteria bacterium]|nr:hypothetical protein [Candidatus Roizmanbacteria bacterium]
MKKNKLFFLILLVVGLSILIFNIQIPCGGMNKNGDTWNGKCAYGPLLIKNIQNGHFFLPLGY